MFKVKLHRRVIKFLQKLSESDRKRIFSTLKSLKILFPSHTRKLRGGKISTEFVLEITG